MKCLPICVHVTEYLLGTKHNQNLKTFSLVSFMRVLLLQTCLRHPDSRSAKGNREGVFKKMREAMATITSVVQDEHQDKLSENGGLAIDLGEFEVRKNVKFDFGELTTWSECAVFCLSFSSAGTIPDWYFLKQLILL